MDIKMPELIQAEDWQSYEYSQLTRYIEKKYGVIKLREFKKWFHGQTGGIYKGKFCVYKDDFEQFLKGLPDLDGGAYG